MPTTGAASLRRGLAPTILGRRDPRYFLDTPQNVGLGCFPEDAACSLRGAGRASTRSGPRSLLEEVKVVDRYKRVLADLFYLQPDQLRAVSMIARQMGGTASSTDRVRRYRARHSGVPPGVTETVTSALPEPLPDNVVSSSSVSSNGSNNGSKQLQVPGITTSTFRSEKQELAVQAREVLRFLNEKTQKNFREVDTNLKMICARISSGVSVDDCKSLVARKVREWKDKPEMQEYLRPKTLFAATNFENYLGELGR